MFYLSPSRLSRTATTLSAFACLLAGPWALAQVTANSPVTYNAQLPFDFTNHGAPTLAGPAGVAVAPDGTVYVADITSGTAGRVIRIVPATGYVAGGSGDAGYLAATATVLAPSITLTRPTAVAVDSAGYLYIADATGHKVIEMKNPETSGTATAITYPVAAGQTMQPTALAVDSSNDLYIADENQNAIYKVTAGGATGAKLALATGTTYHPVGLAVDANNDVFFADTSNKIYEYTSGGSTISYLSLAGNTYAFEFSDATQFPIGMGFDPEGHLYVMDSGAAHVKDDSAHLFEIVSGTDWYLVPFSDVVHTADSLTPAGMAVSSTGNLYLADDSNEAVDELYNNNPVNFGSVDAGGVHDAETATPLVTANFLFNTGVAGATVYQSVQGDNTGEFTTNTATCSGGTGSTGSTCTFTFGATYLSATPGLRMGAVGYTDSDHDTLAVRANGIDLAGSLALYPGTQSTLTQSFVEPQGLAVTGDGGTLFIGDEGGVLSQTKDTYSYSGKVWAYNVSGSAYTQISPDSFPTPLALAVDAAGNLYVADYNGKIYVVQPTVTNHVLSWSSTVDTAKILTITGGVALNHPMALAIDPSGDLFIGDMGPEGTEAVASNPGYIVEIPAGPMVCGTSTCSIGGKSAFKLSNASISGTPIVFPQSLTTDLSGDLYIADGGDGDTDQGGVDVIPVSGTPAQLSLGTLNQASGVSFDAAGDLYVLDGYTPEILVAQIAPSNPATVDDTVLLGTNLEGNGTNGITATLVTPSNLMVWPGGESITITDIGYQQIGQTTTPAQVITLSGAKSTPNITSGTASVNGVNVGNTEITFTSPSKSPSSATGFTLSGCGSASGDTLATGIANTCTSTINYTGKTKQSVIYTLNGNTADDYSALGNEIVVNGVSGVPEASLSAPFFTFSASNTATLENTGGGSLVIGGIQVTGGAAWTGGTCTLGGTLTTDQSCTITYLFSGEFSFATITVTDNSGGGTNVTQTAYSFYFPFFFFF